jgi:uncharacterized membrane protein HdeD (DUF308 family)
MAKAVSMEAIPTNTWWIYLLEGIGAILIGILLLAAPAATIVAITIFLGFYWLFVGVLELVRMFVDRSVPWYWSLLIGLLGIAGGLLVLNHPLFAAVLVPATIVVYLGVLGIIIGILAIIGGFSGGGVGSFIFGVLNLLIGILLLSSPVVATLAVPFVFGILLLIEGIALIAWALRIRPSS